MFKKISNSTSKQLVFNKLSAPNKRMAIARDVIATIKSKKAIVKQGRFLEFPDLAKSHIDGLENLSEVLKVAKKPCKVCGIGSIMLSQLRINGDCKLFDTEISYENVYGDISGYPTGHTIKINPFSEASNRENFNNFIRRYFSLTQLQLIEIAFELGDGYYKIAVGLEDYRWSDIASSNDLVISKSQAKTAIKFGERYKTPKNRLIKIMENIIINNGKFIP